MADLAFGTTRACTARMSVLYQLRAVDRFRPLAPAGSSPLHFVLDEAGTAVIAAEDGATVAGLGYRRDRATAIALSPRLAHSTGANGVFTALAAAARASHGQATLECWWSERRCAATWGDCARPTATAAGTSSTPAARRYRLLPGVRHRHRGPAPAGRQARRLPRPRRPHRHHHSRPVLLPSPRREAALRARLAGPPPHGTPGATAAQVPGVPVATAAPGTVPGGPAGAPGLPAGSPGPRLRLAQLAPPGTAAPAADPGEAPVPAGGLPWYPPAPSPPAWDALDGTPRSPQAGRA
jgi:hypothetical protein